MAKIIVIAVVIAAALIMQISAQKIIVGDDNGWKLSTPGFYDTWAAKQKFVVGTTLVFEFTTGSHSVATVTSKEAYDKCDATLDKEAVIITKGPYEKTLTDAGQYYYFCTIGSHCASGQKFAATVSAATSDNSSTTTPAAPAPPPSAAARSASTVFATLMGLVLALLY